MAAGRVSLASELAGTADKGFPSNSLPGTELDAIEVERDGSDTFGQRRCLLMLHVGDLEND